MVKHSMVMRVTSIDQACLKVSACSAVTDMHAASIMLVATSDVKQLLTVATCMLHGIC